LRPDGILPELRVVLGAARASLDVPSELGDLTGVDPEGVARLAARHRMEGLVHHGLSLIAPSGESGDAVRRAVLGAAVPAAAGNLGRIAELHRLTGIMASAGIPVIAFKGPTLAMQAYGDVSLRSYSDVDVLLPPERSGDVVEALRSAGYTDRRDRSALAASPRHWHEWGVTAPDGVTLVEIHWALTRPTRFPRVISAEAWAEPETVDVLGRPVPALRRELLLPLLCIHSTAHAWSWLEFPASIAGLVSRTEALDWDEVLDRAERWRVRRILSVGLLLAGDLFGAAVPERVAEALLPDQAARRLSSTIGTRLLHEHGPLRTASPALLWTQVRLRDSLADGLSAGRQILFAPTPMEREEGGGEPGSPSPGGSFRRIRRLVRKWRRGG